MNECFKITVEMTLKDIRKFCFNKVYRSIFRKIYFIVTMVVVLLGFYGMYTLFTSLINTEQEKMLILFAGLPLLFLIYTNISPYITQYVMHKSIFPKGNYQIYEFTDTSMNVLTIGSRYTFKWCEIIKVLELRSCFLFYYSPTKFFIIPKRCLNNQELLSKFYNTLVSKIDKNKLKIKKYRINNFSSNHNTVPIFEESNLSYESGNSQTEGEINFSFMKHEISNSYYRIYYSIPVRIYTIGIGIVLIFAFIRIFLYFNESYLGLLFLGLFFSIAPPLIVLFNINNIIKKDAQTKYSYIYKFYSNYFSINYPNGIKFIKWSDIRKVIELKSTFLLHENKRFVHILPKRAFDNKQELFKEFNNHLIEINSNKSR